MSDSTRGYLQIHSMGYLQIVTLVTTLRDFHNSTKHSKFIAIIGDNMRLFAISPIKQGLQQFCSINLVRLVIRAPNEISY